MDRKDLDGKAMCERILSLLGSRRNLDAAKTLGVSSTRISEWLHEKGSPPFDILLAVQHLHQKASGQTVAGLAVICPHWYPLILRRLRVW